MSQHYRYGFIAGTPERTENAWKEFARRKSLQDVDVAFIPSLGGCFIVVSPGAGNWKSLMRKPGGSTIIDEFREWLQSRRPAAGREHRVLVIDDDQSVLKLLKIGLESSGFQVAGFGDAEVALESIDSGEDPDAIVLDLRMPGMDGREFLRQAALRGVHSRVVLASAFDVRVEEPGIDAAISKPFDPEDLVLLLKQLLSEPNESGSRPGLKASSPA